MNIKEHILFTNDRPTKEVDVPEWGVTVHVRTWSARERMQVSNWKAEPDLDARIVALSVVDENYDTVFNTDDVPALQGKSGLVIERLALAAIEHNGIGQEAKLKN